MSTHEAYEKIALENADKILSNKIFADSYLHDSKADKRKGISLIISAKFEGYSELVSRFNEIEPNQYYYSENCLHITIFDFISANESYVINPDIENQYLELSKAVLQNECNLQVEYKGIVLTNAAGIIKGYDNGRLMDIRKALRIAMRKKEFIIDERYESKTAHATFMRYRTRLNDVQRIWKLSQEFAEEAFGTEKIKEVELVEHDWHNRSKRIIGNIKLN